MLWSGCLLNTSRRCTTLWPKMLNLIILQFVKGGLHCPNHIWKWMHTFQVMCMWLSDEMTKRQLFKPVWKPCGTRSPLVACRMKIRNVKAPFGMVNLKLIFASLGHLVGTLGASHAMATHTLKRMRTCKPSCTPFNTCMQKRLKMVWDGTYWEWESDKQLGYEKLTWSSISMNLRWFMDDMTSHPFFCFPCFV